MPRLDKNIASTPGDVFFCRMIGQTLGHYRIAAKIGTGGMGEVYRAQDVQLGRDVAIKVLRQDVAPDAERLRRFELEARAASALNHPNIVTIYEVGRIETTPYIAMEWVDGTPLRDALSGVPMPTRRLLQIGTQLADGLAKAHGAGIVHRDLKPENVMVTEDGLVKILDFGLAKLSALSETLSDAATNLVTDRGIVMGTVGYMSPEQASGRAVDHRSDQFALGLMLYEMATGARPFRKDTAAQTLAAIIEDEPESLIQRSPHTPSHLSVIVSRCLAKKASDRYESTRDLAHDLKDLLESTSSQTLTREAPAPRRRPPALAFAAVAIAIVAVAGTAMWFGGLGRTARNATNDEARRVVAVLPFRNLSADAAQNYFAAGMTEEIRGQLSKLGALRLLSRSAVDRFGEGDVKRLGSELGAGSVVEGSVRLDKERVRIAVELIDSGTEQTLWSEQYDRGLEDVFAVQSDVALQIATALRATLGAGERQRIEKRPTVNLEAYQIYLRSQELSGLDRQQNTRAISLLKNALTLDPRFAVAQARMAYRTVFSAYYDGPEKTDAGIELARKAIEIDPNLPAAHFTLATGYGHKGWATESRVAFQKALDIDPNHLGSMSNLSVLEGEVLGRWDEGLSWGRRMFQRSAHEANDFYHLALPLMFLRDDVTTRRWLEEGERRFPDSARLQILLAALEYLEGKDAEALARARRLVNAHPGIEEAQMALTELAFLTGQPDAEGRIEPSLRRAGDLSASWLVKPESFRTYYASLLARRGETARASELFDQALQSAHKQLSQRDESQRVPMEIAAIHAARGEKDKALEWLSRGRDTGYKDYGTLGRDPLFANLRGEPRFQAIRQQMERDVAAMRERSADFRALRTEPFPAERSPR